jgi:DNA-binding LacI/PurR family transcriptional regulator
VAKVTLQTVADTVGVSRMTVSNAFSRPDQLSAALRQRILAAAEELGYVGPDPSARALARGSTGSVGILLTDSLQYAFSDAVAMSFLGAIAAELAPTGRALTLLSTSEADGLVPARDVPMDGTLVYSCDPETPALSWLLKRRLPLVFVDQVPAPGIPSINVDDRGGARAAAQHLMDLGHRHVAAILSTRGEAGVVEDPRRLPLGHVQRQRLLGWLDALTEHGIEPFYAQAPHYAHEQFAVAARRLLDTDQRPTAVLALTDAIAVATVQAARDMGLRVPDDLSVVGFDDSPLARQLRPSLTTVRQDFHAKGRSAAAALTRAIEQRASGTTGRVRHLLLPVELVVRDSTAPPSR